MKPQNFEVPARPSAARYLYMTPTGEALTAAGQGFVLATSLTAAVVIFANVAAIALGVWAAAVFWNILLFALVPWGFLLWGLLRRLIAFAWPAIEKTAHRDLDRSGVVGDPIRFIKWHGPKFTDDEVHPYEADIRYFIQQITSGRDWTQREWRGEELPSGITCYNEYYAALVLPLVDAGIIQGRTEGGKGTLTITAPTEIEARLGLN